MTLIETVRSVPGAEEALGKHLYHRRFSDTWVWEGRVIGNNEAETVIVGMAGRIFGRARGQYEIAPDYTRPKGWDMLRHGIEGPEIYGMPTYLHAGLALIAAKRKETK